jgi:hypothetical protein
MGLAAVTRLCRTVTMWTIWSMATCTTRIAITATTTGPSLWLEPRRQAGARRFLSSEACSLLQTVITRLMKMLTPRGVLVEEMGQTCLAEPDADGEKARTLRPWQTVAIT